LERRSAAYFHRVLERGIWHPWKIKIIDKISGSRVRYLNCACSFFIFSRSQHMRIVAGLDHSRSY
jgi:hypothetical protein